MKKHFAMLMILLLLMLFSACSSSKPTNSSTETAQTTQSSKELAKETPTSTPSATNSDSEIDTGPSSSEQSRVSSENEDYEAIYNEYAERIRTATPDLVDAYLEEVAVNVNGIVGLADICNQKIEVLAQVSNEGVSQMALLMSSGTGNYDEYSEWAEKLTNVYMEEAAKITDAYTNSITTTSVPETSAAESVLVPESTPEARLETDTEATSVSNEHITLSDGLYVIGEDVMPGKYNITCLATYGDSMGDAYSALGDAIGSLGGLTGNSSEFNALGDLMGATGDYARAVSWTTIEIVGDFGAIIKSYEIKKDESVSITLEDGTALKISGGQCELNLE